MLLQKDQTTEPNFVLYFCLSEIPACLITSHWQINQPHNLQFDFQVLFSRHIPLPNFAFIFPKLAIMFLRSYWFKLEKGQSNFNSGGGRGEERNRGLLITFDSGKGKG